MRAAPALRSGRQREPTRFEERAPFLLRAQPSSTTPRPPDAATFYRDAVEIALADGGVSRAERQRLDAFRLRLGLAEEEAASIHAEVGWDGTLADGPGEPAASKTSASRAKATERSARAGWQRDARQLLRHIEVAIHRAIPELRGATSVDDEVDVATGELWVKLGRTQGVSVWIPSRRGSHVRVAVGFYSNNESRDPAYRRARKTLENGARRSDGWSAFTRESRAGELSLETRTRVRLSDLCGAKTAEDVAAVAVPLVRDAQAALRDGNAGAPPPEAELATPDAHVASATPEDFALVPLVGKPRIEGSVWKARILWALEWARRHDPAPKSAANIAAILTANGVSVPGTNTARAFRVQHDDPRLTGLVEQCEGQTYRITAKGRRALMDLTRSS